MKKKVIILSTVSALALGSALAAVLALRHNDFAFAPAKATDKSFTFNEAVGAEQFDNKYPAQRAAEISVVTGVGSNLETNIRLPKYPSDPTSEEDFGTYYGHSGSGRFVHNGETFSNSYFAAEIGVNNLTSIEVVYGCDKDTVTAATAVYCYIDVYDDVNGWHNDQSGSNGSSFNMDLSLGWNKSMTPGDYTFTKVRVRVGASGGSIYWGEPLYIKSMTLNWSC